MKRILILLIFSFFLSSLVFGQSKDQELYKAITENNVENVSKLLQDSANANYVVGSGAFTMTMLNTAINVSKNKKIVELLLKHKADVNSKDAFNTTALMYAASSGNKK